MKKEITTEWLYSLEMFTFDGNNHFLHDYVINGYNTRLSVNHFGYSVTLKQADSQGSAPQLNPDHYLLVTDKLQYQYELILIVKLTTGVALH